MVRRTWTLAPSLLGRSVEVAARSHCLLHYLFSRRICCSLCASIQVVWHSHCLVWLASCLFLVSSSPSSPSRSRCAQWYTVTAPEGTAVRPNSIPPQLEHRLVVLPPPRAGRRHTPGFDQQRLSSAPRRWPH